MKDEKLENIEKAKLETYKGFIGGEFIKRILVKEEEGNKETKSVYQFPLGVKTEQGLMYVNVQLEVSLIEENNQNSFKKGTIISIVGNMKHYLYEDEAGVERKHEYIDLIEMPVITGVSEIKELEGNIGGDILVQEFLNGSKRGIINLAVNNQDKTLPSLWYRILIGQKYFPKDVSSLKKGQKIKVIGYVVTEVYKNETDHICKVEVMRVCKVVEIIIKVSKIK